MTRTLCGLMLLFAIGCSQSPTAPTPASNRRAVGTTVINLQWNVIAASCAPVTTPPSQPAFAAATIVRQSDTSRHRALAVSNRAIATGTLYAHFVIENNVLGDVLVGHR